MTNRQNQQEIPTPPKANLNKNNEVANLVENLKNWAAYEAAHISIHQSLIQQLNASQPLRHKLPQSDH